MITCKLKIDWLAANKEAFKVQFYPDFDLDFHCSDKKHLDSLVSIVW